MADIVAALPGLLRRSMDYWAIRLFCSAFTRLSVQKVQFGP
jgi:hypothetical protein